MNKIKVLCSISVIALFSIAFAGSFSDVPEFLEVDGPTTYDLYWPSLDEHWTATLYSDGSAKIDFGEQNMDQSSGDLKWKNGTWNIPESEGGGHISYIEISGLGLQNVIYIREDGGLSVGYLYKNTKTGTARKK